MLSCRHEQGWHKVPLQEQSILIIGYPTARAALIKRLEEKQLKFAGTQDDFKKILASTRVLYPRKKACEKTLKGISLEVAHQPNGKKFVTAD